jgi:hypothetical protein
MASLPVVITGSHIILYINNQLYKEVENVTFTVDYGEEEIFGIDSVYAQEIAGGKITVSGSVNSLRLKLSGGLQAKNMRPLFTDVSAAPYISIRIQDRATQEDIIFIPNCKVSNESHTAPNRGVYRVSFNFKGMIPLFALDRTNSQSSFLLFYLSNPAFNL